MDQTIEGARRVNGAGMDKKKRDLLGPRERGKYQVYLNQPKWVRLKTGDRERRGEVPKKKGRGKPSEKCTSD